VKGQHSQKGGLVVIYNRGRLLLRKEIRKINKMEKKFEIERKDNRKKKNCVFVHEVVRNEVSC